MTPQERAAIESYRLGYSIFPLRPRSKDPHSVLLPIYEHEDGTRKPSWKPYQTERATPKDVALWFEMEAHANHGIATGARSGFFAVDADTEEARAWFEDRYPINGPVVQTSASFKRQYYFRHPGFLTQNRASKIFPGLDIRGDGGFVVGAGSIHPNGRTYTYLVSPFEVELPEAPQWLLDAVRKPEFAPVMSEPIKIDPQDPKATRLQRYAIGALNLAAQRVRDCSDGTKADTLFKETASLAGFLPHGLLDAGEIKAMMYQAVEGRAKNKRLAFQTIENAIRRGQNEPCRLPI